MIFYSIQHPLFSAVFCYHTSCKDTSVFNGIPIAFSGKSIHVLTDITPTEHERERDFEYQSLCQV